MDNNMYNMPEENQPAPQYQQEIQQPQGTSGMAIASMVCGIVSILACCFWPLAVILSIVAIVLGVIAINKKTAGKGMAIAGIVTGALGIVITVIYIFFIAAMVATSGLSLQ